MARRKGLVERARGHWEVTGWFGRIGLVVVLFGCCVWGLAGLFLVEWPGAEVTPAAEVGERVGTAVVELTEEPAATTGPMETATAVPTGTGVVGAVEPLGVATSEPASPISPTAVPPTAVATVAPTGTAVPPTAIPTATVPATEIPATAAPTVVPQPTETLPISTTGDVVIASVRYDGDVADVESDEYAVILNRGGVAVDVGGWRLNAGEPDQNFVFPAGTLLGPGQSCRVYTNEVHPESCGFSFGRGDAIWRNSSDCGFLFDGAGVEMSRFCW